jgi:hypothetical protein
MAMGGFLSLADKWEDFDQRWNGTLLYSHNLSHSHTVDLIHRKNEFKGWTDERHNEFVLGARELMNEHLNAGFVAVLRRDDYHKHYKALPKPRKPPGDTMYGVFHDKIRPEPKREPLPPLKQYEPPRAGRYRRR